MSPSRHILFALLGLVHVSHGHGIMVEPRPYNLETEPLHQVGPLSAELPFPCQGRTQHVEARTVLTAGTDQTVRFRTSAVHGGGSCQFSLTYEHPPPADAARWKTLYTIIGGCPAQAAGNLPTVATDASGREDGPQCGNDSGAECVRQFDVPIPAALASGNATFAFTWFNLLGNREMYMSCAPVSIVGGTGDDAFMASLPPVFQANTPGTCTTGPSGLLLNIPNPGRFGRVYAEPSPGGNGQCPAAPSPSFAEARAPSSGTPGPAYSSSSSSSSSSSTVSPPSGSTRFMTVTTTVSPGTSAQPMPSSRNSTTSSSTSSSGVKTSTSAAPTETTGLAAQPEWAAGMVRCTAAAGNIECFEQNTFGLCNEGWAEPLPLSDDLACVDGEISRKFVADVRRRL